jgi:hypothetical protein
MRMRHLLRRLDQIPPPRLSVSQRYRRAATAISYKSSKFLCGIEPQGLFVGGNRAEEGNAHSIRNTIGLDNPDRENITKPVPGTRRALALRHEYLHFVEAGATSSKPPHFPQTEAHSVCLSSLYLKNARQSSIQLGSLGSGLYKRL